MSSLINSAEMAGSDQVRDDTASRVPGAIYLVGLALGFVGALAIQLPNIRLQSAGVGMVWIGTSTAFQAAGIVIGALLSVPLTRRWGTALIMGLGFGMAGLALVLMSTTVDWLWISIVRIVMAIGTGVVLTTAEYVLVARAPVHRRATLLALYATCGLAGQVFAPMLLSITGSSSGTPLLLSGYCMMALACLPYLAGIRRRVEPDKSDSLSLRLLWIAPVPFIPAFAFGVMDGGMIELLNLFMIQRNYSIGGASLVALAAVLGALCLQVPAAIVSDRLGHTRVLRVVWFLLALSIGALNYFSSPWAILLVAFVLGGVCDALYSIGFSALADSLPRGSLATANSGFVALCGVGEVVGPVIGGAGISIQNGMGFTVVFMGIAIVGFYCAWKLKR